jgi:ribosomal protein S18 acetylase RimI-like enzyme
VEIKRANTFDENYIRTKISEVFVDGFGNWFVTLSKNKELLIKAFSHMFVLDMFYVAIIDNEIIGITACTNGIAGATDHDKKELIKYFGFIKGTIINMIFNKEFKKQAIETGEKIGSIEFVAILKKYHRQGIASGLINGIIKMTEYKEYILEVADTNNNALKLYEKLGFKEFKRMEHKYKKQSGINYLIYMKYKKENN